MVSGHVCGCVGLMASPAGWIAGGTGIPGTGVHSIARHGMVAIQYPGNEQQQQQHQHQHQQQQQETTPDWLMGTATAPLIPPTAVAYPQYHVPNAVSIRAGTTVKDVLQPVYRDLQFPYEREHRSAAVAAGLPRPLHSTTRPPTLPPNHPPLTHTHTTPHSARTTFGFECHASCPSLSPCPPACSTLSRPPTPTLAPCPCPCPRTLPLPTLPSAAAAARALGSLSPAPCPMALSLIVPSLLGLAPRSLMSTRSMSPLAGVSLPPSFPTYGMYLN